MNSLYPWQTHQWQFLQNQRAQNRLPHALLLCGPEGLGKFNFARIFARSLLCDLKNDDTCSCKSCQLFNADCHPDFFLITPEENSKNIKVEALRQMIESLNQTSHRNGYQVALIYPAEAMNIASSNALLKTLEEPLGSVLFLLVSHQLGKLPATILSRCQKINFAVTLDKESSLAWLKDKLKPQEMAILLKAAQGSPLKAINLAEDHYFVVRKQILEHLLKIVNKEINPLAFSWNYKAQDNLALIDIWLSLIYDALKLKLAIEPRFIIHSDCLQPLKRLAQNSPIFLQGRIDSLLQARQLIQGSIAINSQLLIESLLLEWSDDVN